MLRVEFIKKQLADSSKTPLPCPSTTSSGPSAAAEADANLSSSTAHSERVKKCFCLKPSALPYKSKGRKLTMHFVPGPFLDSL